MSFEADLPQPIPNKESHGHHDFSPLQWSTFFDEQRFLQIDENQFNIYLKGNTGPIFLLLHGNSFPVYSFLLFTCGGYTGLTWACFVEELSSKIECQIVAPDLRSHGLTTTTNDEDLSTERLVKDIADIYSNLFSQLEEKPPMVVIGHSLGGALAIHLVSANMLPNVVAMSVIDVVEGTAMASLSLMSHFLHTRPQTFPNYERAIRWCFESGSTRNVRSARVSMPSQLKHISKEKRYVLTWISLSLDL